MRRKGETRHNAGAIMRISKGEKIYKIFIFKPISGRAWNFEYRIIIKEKKDGNLEMAAYSYKEIDGNKIKGDVTHSPDVPKDKLDDIIQGVMRRTGTKPDEFYEIDLSNLKNIDEQINYIKKKSNLFDINWIH